jgi:hypothetical protein
MSEIFSDLASLEETFGYKNLSNILNKIDEIADNFNTELNKNSSINNNLEKLNRAQLIMINFILFIAQKQKDKNAKKVFAKIAYSFYLDYILSIYKIAYENLEEGKKQKGGAKMRVFRNGELIRIDSSQLRDGDIPAVKVVGLDGVERYVPADDSDSEDELAFANGWGHGNAALVVGENALQNIQNGRPPVQPQQSMVQYEEDEGSVYEFSTSQYGEQPPVTQQPDVFAFLPREEREAMERQIIDIYKTEAAIMLEKKKLELESVKKSGEIMEQETIVALEAQKEKMRLLKGLPNCVTCLECAVWGTGGGVTTSVSVWALKQLGYLTIVKPIENLGSATVEGAKIVMNATVEGVKSVHDSSLTAQQAAKLASNIATTLDNVGGGVAWTANSLFELGSVIAWGSKEGANKLYTTTGSLYNYVTTDQTSSNLRSNLQKVIENVAESGASNATSINLNDYVIGVLQGGQLYDLTNGELLWMDAAHTIPATTETAGIPDASNFELGKLLDETYNGLPVFDTDSHARTITDVINNPSLMASDFYSCMTAKFNSMWNALEHSCPSYTGTLEAARPYVETPEFVCGFAGCCIMSSLYVARESMWRKSVAAAIATEGRSDSASNTLANSMARTTEFVASTAGQTALNVGTGAAAICFPGAAASLATFRAITGSVGPKNQNVQRTLGVENRQPGFQRITDSSRQSNVPETMMLSRGQEPSNLRQRKTQGYLIENNYEQPVKGPPAPGWSKGADGKWRPPPPPRRGGKSIRKNIKRRTHKKRIMKRRKVTRKVRKARRTRKYRK